MSEFSPDEFLAEIPGDNPAGEPLPYHVRAELDEARKEINPDDYDPADLTRPTEFKPADWAGIVATATRTLKETSKDLLVAARLTEALTQIHGFDGLAGGLAVMRGMVDQCWDRMYPDISDGDLEVRAGPFNWLADADRGARFPHAVRSAPLLSTAGQTISWVRWRGLQDGKGDLSRDDFEKAIAAADRAACQEAVDAVTRALSELNALSPALAARLGPDSPGMIDLRTAVGDCYGLARQILEKKGAPPVAEDGGEGGEAADGGGTTDGGRPGGRVMATRADVYARLAEAAALLEQIEPHSPVPYLIRKAVEFGGLPFPDLMRALIRDDSVLSEMNRELGIKPPAGGWPARTRPGPSPGSSDPPSGRADSPAGATGGPFPWPKASNRSWAASAGPAFTSLTTSRPTGRCRRSSSRSS